MSHAATKWAFDQPEVHRDMKPSEWAVLMVLADCHNPIHGCFPSQDYICSKTNLGERAVRDQLTRLRERGLIDWDMARENGRRGSNRYKLGFETDFQPANSAGSSEGVSTGKIEQFQPADSDSYNRQNLPPNLVKEPVKEPLSAQARGREGENSVDRKKAEADGWALLKDWPGFAGMPKEPALREWLALTPEEREAAKAKFPAWLALLKQQKKSHFPAPSTYFREKLFRDVLDPDEAPAQPVEAKPFGPLWNATIIQQLLLDPQPAPPPPSAFLRELLRRDDDAGRAERKRRQIQFGWPHVNDWYHRAESRKGFAVQPDQAWMKDLMEPVPVSSSMFEGWRAEYERRGWPWLPDWGSQPVVFFPKGGPQGLDEFERAVRAQDAEDDGSEREAG